MSMCMDSSTHSPYRDLGKHNLNQKNWMQKSKRDVYLGAYLNGPDNYLKGIINSALKGLDDTPQSKSKVVARWIVVKCNRQKGNIECGYYYFNDAQPLESKRLKALCIQWATYYLKVKIKQLVFK
ncbi:hypothetical protein HKD37_12G034458 [Glycine soja]